ncbi:low molecular weight protein-tyrosine-phosphatase [Tenacibaculum maritimum]|uniref:protein-tyrosine-phosphatase n=1 Tax=Tenacibaculum maritimum NCIMB 2154 TaxID=1349785 RepID=A0A2H1EA66_9FLAO|nr:low molecular weight protein-tyrosine-phosphatase [Tenacibaculum maritimum]MCD9561804.1 low molecular weight phosphotyrosine protein phosphatase [Tenacibaculum maritimum]MCD9565240.1 low molecular weight phosphotyrosine protein phosphatase [Tenacibaculum maritimum]MCD9578640.1 low molecular weight phosphotyrosine protein phosphatase [Tenacibaculum maritimum]MCD9596484.1 low molecular weight phosphotyrosine protein phosphatase [Tenacibaculum maritimum]MCD9609904.1 low molecular weight phosph
MKILMVCLGNICRSPLAEGILKSKVDSKKVFVDSAGTAAYHEGEQPDKRSILIARENGIDITNQRARKFEYSDFLDFDLIYAMDESNYQNILSLAKNKEDREKVKLILKEVAVSENNNVPDPYYGGDKGFKIVYQMLNEACDSIVSKL